MTTSERQSRAISGMCALALLLGSVTSAAADTAEEQRAVALFEKGRRLARDGKCAEAIAPLLESVRTVEGVGPLLNLGNCYETLGKTASALRYFTRAKEVAGTRADPRRDEAAARARVLEKDVPTLLVRIPPALRAAGVEVRVDDEVWPRDRWDVAAPIDPGTHTIEVLSASLPKQGETVTLRGKGDRAEWTAVAPAAPPAARPAPKPEPETAKRPPEPIEDPGGTQRTLAIVAGGLGIGGLVLGGVFGVQAFGDHASVIDRCPTYPRCPESERTQIDRLNTSAENNGTIATIAMVSGVLLLVGGAVLYLTAPGKPEPRPRALRSLLLQGSF